MKSTELAVMNEGYVSGINSEGLFYEGFFNCEYHNVVLFLPGDCFGSWAFIEFAGILYRQGYCVFLLNYVNGYRCVKIPDKEVTNQVYTQNCQDLTGCIISKYKLNQDKYKFTYMAYSRGCLVLQKYLSKIVGYEDIILISPMINYGKRKFNVSLKLVLEVFLKFLSADKIKLSYETFCKRFLGKDVPENQKKYLYKKSEYIYKNVILKKEKICYQTSNGRKIHFVLLLNDKANDSEGTLKNINHLKKDLYQDFDVFLVEGAHCEIITHPQRFVKNILSHLYGGKYNET